MLFSNKRLRELDNFNNVRSDYMILYALALSIKMLRSDYMIL